MPLNTIPNIKAHLARNDLTKEEAVEQLMEHSLEDLARPYMEAVKKVMFYEAAESPQWGLEEVPRRIAKNWSYAVRRAIMNKGGDLPNVY